MQRKKMKLRDWETETPENTTPLVSVCCTTFQHVNYIRDAIEGFLNQAVNFSVEIIIRDDASTDGTATIVEEYATKYPSVIRPILNKENLWTKGVSPMRDCMSYAQGKYIAVCEGDDYWTDPNKLQRQVDFLEANKEYVICSHRYKVFNEETKEWKPDYGHSLFAENIEGIEFDNDFNLNKDWLTKTMTVVFRKECLDLPTLCKYQYARDIHIYYHLLKIGKGYCMNYDAAVYRQHLGGVHSLISEYNRIVAHYKLFSELYLKNKKDDVLNRLLLYYKDLFYCDIINKLAEEKYSKSLRLDIKYFLKTEYSLEGLRVCKYSLKFLLPIMKSLVKKTIPQKTTSCNPQS